MNYSIVPNYFESLGEKLVKVVTTCKSLAEFADVKSNLNGLTYVVEDLNWKPENVKDNARQDSEINWQMWIPLVEPLDAIEVNAAKDVLMQQSDQIIAKLIFDSEDREHPDQFWLKFIEWDSLNFVIVSDYNNRDAIGVRGVCNIKVPTTYTIDAALWI
jgi:hypothetical protein